MTIERIENEQGITLKLEGWLDTVSAQELGAAAENIGEAPAVILDFEKVEYIASAGLRQVIAINKAAKDRGADFSVINAGAEVMSIFKLTGLDKKLSIAAK